MIRKFAYNRIFRTTGMLLLLLLLLIFPASKEYSLDDTTIKTSYSKKQREVYLIDKNNYVARCKLDISAYTQEEYAKKLVERDIISQEDVDWILNNRSNSQV